MSFRQDWRRRSRDVRWVIGALVALLAVFLAGFVLLQWSPDLPPALMANRVLLFVLWYVNVILILVVAFVLARNLFKLLVERRAKILGSQFKTKLVLTYFGLSLVPVLLLFLLSTQLFKGSINQWFSASLERNVELGSRVAQELAITLETMNFRDARRALTEIELMGLTEPAARPALDRRLAELISTLELDYLAVYEGTELIHAAISAKGALEDLPQPGRPLLREAMAQGQARGQPTAKTSGALLVSAVRGGEGSGEAPVLVVAGRVLPAELSTASRSLIETAQSYRQLAVQQDDLKASYYLILLMLTLVILLASSWVGLYLARRVTVPIQALADATRRISMGDLEHPVETSADDELGVLVASFNRMTAELKANREELARTQQLAAWREAAQRIAHEIKNPLTPIQLAAERLLARHRRGEEDLGPLLEESVDTIRREVTTLKGLVDEFSSYARMPQPRPSPVDLGPLVTDTLLLYRGVKPGVEVSATIAADMGLVWIDREQIRRVLLNLVDNAIEATEAPGTVVVLAERQQGQLVIEVADSGRGIPAEARDKLFLPYYSTKGRGTGLGLAIVHRIVTDHGGRITALDNSPRGTRFRIELPADPPSS